MTNIHFFTPRDVSPCKPLLKVDTGQRRGPEPALMAILESSGGPGVEASAHSSPGRGVHSHGDAAHHTRVCFLGAPGLPEPWTSMPSCAPGPHRCHGGHPTFQPEPSLPALRAASGPRASVPGEVLLPPGEKDPAQGTWDPSGKEALRLVSVIGEVGYLCACVCV